MVAAAYTSDLGDIYMFESATGVFAYGGGGAGLSADPDFAMEGTNSVNKQITAADKGFMWDDISAFTIGADDHFFVWIMGSTPGLNDSRDNHGIHAAIGDGTADFVKFHVDGNDTLPLGGGKPYAIRFVNTGLTNFRTLVGTPGTTPSWIGGGLNTTATVKGANLGVDAARIGTGYDIEFGTGADDPGDFAGILADDISTSEGVFQSLGDGYGFQGKLRFGNSTNECEHTDANSTITVLDTIHSLTDFNEILIENSSSIINWTNIGFFSLGTNSPGRLEMITDTATVNLTGGGFNDWADFVLGSGATFTGVSWNGCGQITANSSDLPESSIAGYEGTANTSCLLWNDNTDPNGNLDGMSFAMGSASTHAIEFGTASPLSMTLTNCIFTGYNTTTDNQDDSTFHIKRTSGTVTINIAGTGTSAADLTYRSDGATVVIQGSVTITLQNVISSSQCSVHAVDDDSELMNETAGGGDVTEGYAGSTPRSVYIRVRHASSSPQYLPWIGSGQIVADTGLTVSIDQIESLA